MESNLYADGVVAIRLTNGMIRVEFGVLPVLDSAEVGVAPKVETAFRIVVTPKTFVNMFGKMERMMHALAESGVIVDAKQDQRNGPARDQTLSLVAEDRRGGGTDRRNHSYQVRE